MPNVDLNKLNTLPDDLRDNLSLHIQNNWDELVAALFQLARGVYREEVRELKDGAQEIRIYREKPDKEVAQYLLNQVVGKPKENVTLAGRVNFIMDQ